VEQIESTLLEGGGRGDDLHGVVIHHDSVPGDGAQVGQQSLKAVNGLTVFGLPGMGLLKSLW
jgi:hypothetical protein